MDPERLGTAFVLVGLIAYGLEPVVAELGGLFLAPLLFAGLAALLAGSLALVVGLWSRSKLGVTVKRTDYLRLIFTGFFGTFVAFACLFVGLQLTSSNNAAIILRSEVVFALLFGYVFLRETISPRQAVWMGLMVAGVLLVLATTQAFVVGVGDLLILVTPAAWATGHTFAKPTLQRVSPWLVVALRNLVGGSFLLLGFALGFVMFRTPPVLVPEMSVIVLVIAAEVAVILLSHGLWYESIRRINLGKATGLIAPAPLVTFGFSVLLFSLTPTWWQFIGALLVIAATILLSREASLRRPPKSG
jgi:drug/metabolite transporter (DMT)-like permease